jgi:transposase
MDLEQKPNRYLMMLELRGIGVLCASALSNAIGYGYGYGYGYGEAYRKRKDFAASLGLTPRQRSNGVDSLGIGE